MGKQLSLINLAVVTSDMAQELDYSKIGSNANPAKVGVWVQAFSSIGLMETYHHSVQLTVHSLQQVIVSVIWFKVIMYV